MFLIFIDKNYKINEMCYYLIYKVNLKEKLI